MLALLDADDSDHENAVAAVEGIAGGHFSFVTNYVQVEAHALLLRGLGRKLALHWLLQSGLTVVRATPNEEHAAVALLVRYADKDWSLCDAISFAVIEARGVGYAFTFDRHFAQFGRARLLGPRPM